MPDPSWEMIKEKVETLCQTSVFDDLLKRTVQTFLEFAQDRYVVPDLVQKGYWPTISFVWVAQSVEIEFHHHAIEVYQFFDGATEIQDISVGDAGLMQRALELQLGPLVSKLLVGIKN